MSLFLSQPTCEGVALCADAHFPPARAAALELADGQGIEELIRHKEQRLVRQGVDRVDPLSIDPTERVALNVAELLRGFEQRHLRRKAGYLSGGAQDIAHERAAPGAKFSECERSGRPLIHPRLRQTQSNEFTKHL